MPAFADLNISADEKLSLKDKFAMAAKLGYEVVAVTTIYKKQTKEKTKQKEKTQTTSTLAPVEYSYPGLRILNRIQFVDVDHGIMHMLASKEIQAYDIVAVNATEEKHFKTLVDSHYVDIITLDVSDKLPFYLKHSPVGMALARGIHFEIKYSQAIRDSSLKRQMISTAQQLIRCCKGKNMILSSGAERAIEIRGPYDVANLGVMLGLKPGQAHLTVSENWKAVLKNSEGRKLCKAAAGHMMIKELKPEDEWVKMKLDAETQEESNVAESQDAKQKMGGKKRKINEVSSDEPVKKKKKKKQKMK